MGLVRARVPSEEAEQAAVAMWLGHRRVWYCHVPNGGYRHPKTAAKLKAAGVQPGVPDLLIFDRPPARPDAVGVALEMKKQGISRPSPSQKVWLEAMAARGWLCAVKPGAHAAISWLLELGF